MRLILCRGFNGSRTKITFYLIICVDYRKKLTCYINIKWPIQTLWEFRHMRKRQKFQSTILYFVYDVKCIVIASIIENYYFYILSRPFLYYFYAVLCFFLICLYASSALFLHCFYNSFYYMVFALAPDEMQQSGLPTVQAVYQVPLRPESLQINRSPWK